jgi:transcriptional regulator GlxA family with amidase domain
MKKLMFVISLALFASAGARAAAPSAPPKLATVKVAFVLSEGAVMIDFAGPWEVFQDVMLPGYTGDMSESMPYELYTVAPSRAPVHTSGGYRNSGGHGAGMDVTPDYTFADAPLPDIVVIGAQSGGPGLSAWLLKVHAQHKTIMTVCNGVFRLAESGLLDGKSATSHHGAYDAFASQFPKVKLVRSVRYVESDPTIYTAGGLTSGIDLALHMVALRYGETAAQQTADQMEYQGTGWKTNLGLAAAASDRPAAPAAKRLSVP